MMMTMTIVMTMMIMLCGCCCSDDNMVEMIVFELRFRFAAVAAAFHAAVLMLLFDVDCFASNNRATMMMRVMAMLMRWRTGCGLRKTIKELMY